MPRRTINGVELFVEDSGGDGPVIVFHHGYTGSHDTWVAAVEALRGTYRCVVMDCRGAGDSAHPDEGYTLEQYALDVIGVADALGVDRFTFVGHSMGGGIGFRLGLDHADRLDALVLVAPVPSGGVQAPPEFREAAKALWYARDAEELVRQRIDGAARPERIDEGRMRADVDRALSVSVGHYERSWDSFATLDVTDQLDRLTTPTLVVVGAADGLARANVTDYLRLPNASLHVFNRVGHLVPTDAPEAFIELIDDFMVTGVVTARTLQERIDAGRPAATAQGR
jgi:pimeloyl-ACP methyl ester carboxylesterase